MADKVGKKILIRPVITEKTLKLVETLNKYTFAVSASANKPEIAKAVTEKFDVKVLNVKTVTTLGKFKLFGKDRTSGRRPSLKKAVITL
ncbi:MAG TPA: 50S ribosomal protein L23, partial [Patescibacteria group bacterium]|nr:50S ribosomal protein L23 [Patescibacteria group bacterium]